MTDAEDNMTGLRQDVRVPRVDVTVLGAGAVFRECWLPAFHLTDACRLRAVVDARAEDIRSHLGDQAGAALITSDALEWLNHNAPTTEWDTVIVALPNHLHEPAVAAALAQGFHVLCEKPLALTAEACTRLAELARQRGKLLGVGMAWRYMPPVRALHEALRAELIGNVESAAADYGGPYAWPADTDAPFKPVNGGVLADIGVHLLDLLEDFLGPLVPVAYEDDWGGGVEANADYKLRAQRNDAPVRLRLSRTTRRRNVLSVRGQRGILEFHIGTYGGCHWIPSNAAAFEGQLSTRQPFENPAWPAALTSCFAQQLADFCRGVRAGGSPVVDAMRAARTAELIQWAYNRHEAGRQAGCVRVPAPPDIRGGIAGKVVVTGGTGFIGGQLVSRLAAIGVDEITIPVRAHRTCAQVARFPVALPKIDLLDAAAVDGVTRGARYLFHLAFGRDGREPARVTVEGTRNVVEAAIRHGVEAVVVLSTMYVFGHPPSPPPVDESWPYDPVGGEYGHSKRQMERWCLERAAGSLPTRIVVLNPTCVFGPGGETYARLPRELARQGKFCWIGGGRGIANVTYVDNLVDAMLLAATCPAAHGRRFIVNDGHLCWKEFLSPFVGEFAAAVPSYTREELVRASHALPRAGWPDLARALTNNPELLDVLNRIPALRKTKGHLLRWVPQLRESVLALRQSSNEPRPPMAAPPSEPPPVWLADLFGDTNTVFSSAQAQAVLGWRPQIDLETARQRTMAWIEEQEESSPRT